MKLSTRLLLRCGRSRRHLEPDRRKHIADLERQRLRAEGHAARRQWCVYREAGMFWTERYELTEIQEAAREGRMG
jgi:hypothetical protein